MDTDEAEAIASRLRALSDPTRLQLICCLFSGEACVGELCKKTDLSVPLVSHHLKLLRIAKLVEDRKVGRFKFYRLNADASPLPNKIALGRLMLDLTPR